MAQTLKIGTRGSKLALIQANMVADKLREHHKALEVEIVEILTSGDWKPEDGETRLSEVAGGKGQFAKEIERAILTGAVDCGVHSMKDMDSFLPEGLGIDHILPREDPRDAFLSNEYKTLMDMPAGATIGTSSVRRQAFILAKRPDLKVVPLRGNVPTRIEKLRSGKVDATILALAGLKRMGLEHEIASIIEPENMLPAVGQGAIGIETRQNDKKTRDLLDLLHCPESGLCVKCERAALKTLDGSCHSPIGASARLSGTDMTLTVIIAEPDGQQLYKEKQTLTVSSVAQAENLGQKVGNALKKRRPILLT